MNQMSCTEPLLSIDIQYLDYQCIADTLHLVKNSILSAIFSEYWSINHLFSVKEAWGKHQQINLVSYEDNFERMLQLLQGADAVLWLRHSTEEMIDIPTLTYNHNK